MNKRTKTLYVKRVKEIEYCDSKILYLQGGEYELPFHVKPTETQHNLETCDNCKSHHKLLIKEFKSKLKEFPNCCESHSRLVELPEFNKDDFKDTPLMFANAIMYSYHHFLEFLDHDHWFEEITQYFEYCIESFGSIPPDYGSPYELGNYFSCLLHLMKGQRGKLKSSTNNATVKELNVRFERIVSYLEGYFENERQKEKNINLLLAKYNDWYKIFPFDLSYFKHLKEKYQKTIPVFNGGLKHNKYLGTIVREVHTKESLAEVLIKITTDIISNINGLSLYENGQLTDVEKINLELVIENRKIELKEIERTANKTNKIFIKTLKKWFKEEKKFIEEITPLLKNKKPSYDINNRPNRTDIALYCYYMNETNLLKLSNPFPSTKAWKEISEQFNRNSKNIQQTYNEISSDRSIRLKKSKVQNIEFVIKSMLTEHIPALELAKDELKLAQLNL